MYVRTCVQVQVSKWRSFELVSQQMVVFRWRGKRFIQLHRKFQHLWICPSDFIESFSICPSNFILFPGFNDRRHTVFGLSISMFYVYPQNLILPVNAFLYTQVRVFIIDTCKPLVRCCQLISVLTTSWLGPWVRQWAWYFTNTYC